RTGRRPSLRSGARPPARRGHVEWRESKRYALGIRHLNAQATYSIEGGAMVATGTKLERRRFLKSALGVAAAAATAPAFIPASAIGRDGQVAPSERVIVGGIGIGSRGTYDLGCFLEQKDVQFAAVCDVKERQRLAVKKRADELYGNQS